MFDTSPPSPRSEHRKRLLQALLSPVSAFISKWIVGIYQTINTITSPEEKTVLLVSPLKHENGSFSASFLTAETRDGKDL